MNPIEISPIPESLSIEFDGSKISLPSGIRTVVDEHWRELVSENADLRNGEVFSVTSIKETKRCTAITLAETDYAHYLYSRLVGGLGAYTVRIIHPAALVVSSDNNLIFGSMGPRTSMPSVIQCCGGGIAHSDIRNGVVDTEHGITRELTEELGIDAHDTTRVEAFYPAYLKSGGPTGKMTVVYSLLLKQSGVDFQQDYMGFVQGLKSRHMEPEFEELFCVDGSERAVEAFIARHDDRLNEYMPDLLRVAHRELFKKHVGLLE